MPKEQALKHISNAWVVGIVSAAVTMLVILVSRAGGTLAPGLKLDRGAWERPPSPAPPGAGQF